MRFGLYNWTKKDPVLRLKEGARIIVEAFKEMKAAWLLARRGAPSLSALTETPEGRAEVEDVVRPNQVATEEAVLTTADD